MGYWISSRWFEPFKINVLAVIHGEGLVSVLFSDFQKAMEQGHALADPRNCVQNLIDNYRFSELHYVGLAVTELWGLLGVIGRPLADERQKLRLGLEIIPENLQSYNQPVLRKSGAP